MKSDDEKHREFLRLAWAGLVLRGYDKERDIPDPILRMVWRYGKRIQKGPDGRSKREAA